MKLVRLIKFKDEGRICIPSLGETFTCVLDTESGIQSSSEIGILVEHDEFGKDWILFYEPINEDSVCLDVYRTMEGYEAIESLTNSEMIELLETTIKFAFMQKSQVRKAVQMLSILKAD